VFTVSTETDGIGDFDILCCEVVWLGDLMCLAITTIINIIFLDHGENPWWLKNYKSKVQHLFGSLLWPVVINKTIVIVIITVVVL